MNRFAVFCLCVTMCLPVAAVEEGRSTYVGGTVSGLSAGVIGRLDTASQTALAFEYSGTRLTIPYVAIDSFEYSQEVKRHLGVLPAIAVGLVRHRQRRHFFRISYHDERNVSQVVIFEVSKHTPRSLEAVLETRAPQGCRLLYARCRPLK